MGNRFTFIFYNLKLNSVIYISADQPTLSWVMTPNIRSKHQLSEDTLTEIYQIKGVSILVLLEFPFIRYVDQRLHRKLLKYTEKSLLRAAQTENQSSKF